MGEARPKQAQSEYQRVNALMKEIGSPNGFDPLPPDQHRWMMDPNVPPLQRMWGWMIKHTVHWGHRSPYAISQQQGHELHIEHAAKDLGMDVANAHHTWKKGVDRGLWRNGQPSEGPRRLYLTGKVPKSQQSGDGKLSVQTIFPVHILKQIKDWTPERRNALRDSLEAEIRFEKDVQAALIAANRAIFINRQDSIYLAQGVKPEHQKHTKRTETPADIDTRHTRITPILASIQLYVQTIQKSVQSSSKSVQTNASLLNSESKNQRSSVPVGRNSARSRDKQTHHEGEKSSYNQLPVLETEPLTQAEKHAEQMLFTEIRNLQVAFPHMDFSKEQICAKCKNDRLFVHRVIATVGPDYVDQFLIRVGHQLKNLDKNAFGKLPGSAPAPRSLGLILHWARLYAESMDEAARLSREKQEQWEARHLAACREILEDPAETADAKYIAKQWIDEYLKSKSAAA